MAQPEVKNKNHYHLPFESDHIQDADTQIEKQTIMNLIRCH